MVANVPARHRSSSFRTSSRHLASCPLSGPAPSDQRCARHECKSSTRRPKKMRSLRRIPRRRVLPIKGCWSRALWAVWTRALWPSAHLSPPQLRDAGPDDATDTEEQHGAKTFDRAGREASERHCRRPYKAQEASGGKGSSHCAASTSTSHRGTRSPSASPCTVSAAVSATVSAARSKQKPC